MQLRGFIPWSNLRVKLWTFVESSVDDQRKVTHDAAEMAQSSQLDVTDLIGWLVLRWAMQKVICTADVNRSVGPLT